MQAIISALMAIFLFTGMAFATPPEPLPVDEAFRLGIGKDEDRTTLTWEVAKGYYLYRDHFAVTRDGVGVKFQVSKGETKEDPGFGTVEVLYDLATVSLLSGRGVLQVTYQGCQEGGICYRPEVRYVDLASLKISSEAAAAGGAATGLAAAGIVVAGDEGAPSSILRGESLAWVTLSFLGFGLLLAFTPCVFPIYPIVLGMLGAQGERASALRGFALSVTYVASLAAAFALVGALVGWTGQNIQFALQSPATTLLMALIFLLLAASSFGLFELQLPGFLASRLTRGRTGSGGSLGSAAVLGFSSALVVGPCVTAPLAGALLYIAQGGDWRLGALALFALGMGKGLPLIVMASFGGRFLPRAGRWMGVVRRLFGFGFVAMAVWIAAPLLPQGFDLALYAMVMLVLAADLALRSRGLWSKSASLVLALAASGMVVASLADGSAMPPAAARISLSTSVPPKSPLRFARTETIEGLVKQFDAADGKPVMVYVTADWCVICRSIERGVLPDEEVVKALKDMHLVKLDVTDFGKDTQALLNELKVAGPPTMMFFDAARREMTGTRLIGGMSPAELARSARRAGEPQ